MLITVYVDDFLKKWVGEYVIIVACLKGEKFFCIGRIFSLTLVEVSPCFPAFRISFNSRLFDGECSFVLPLSFLSSYNTLFCFDDVIRSFNVAGYRLFTGLSLPGHLKKFDGKIRELSVEPVRIDNSDNRYTS